MDLFTIFVTGLFAGGLTCLAVQGGLLASSVAHQEETQPFLSIFSFLLTRLFAYTIVGFFLGSLGSVAQLSIGMRVILQSIVAIFMIGTALNLLNVHPLFRYFVIQPPKFLTRLVRTQSKSKSIFGPALLGMSTILIPCGATQAMMAYSVSTGSPFLGAMTMFIFILGTSPLFFILGYVARKFGSRLSYGFNKVAAFAIIAVALYNLNGVVALSGVMATNQPSIAGVSPVDEATIYFTQEGYKPEPSVIAVKAGSKVKLKLVNETGSGCIQAFTIPKFGIQQIVRMGTSAEITFDAPNMSGTIPFMCGMGMYRGTITII